MQNTTITNIRQQIKKIQAIQLLFQLITAYPRPTSLHILLKTVLIKAYLHT